MAADVFDAQFTRVYNGLFRDPRLSFKAKGIFGLMSTHRDGYGLSLESIAACAPDGVSGVRTGLLELIKFNYLQRDRKRDNLGRLGDSVYFITDMPDGLILLMNPDWDTSKGKTSRSEPECEFPQLAEPTVDDRSDKKNKLKKTNNKKTKPLPPSREPKSGDATPRSGICNALTTREAPPNGTGPTAGQATSAVPAPANRDAQGSATAGLRLLNTIARSHGPEFLLTGKTLSDQAHVVDEMLAEGWTPQEIRHIVAGRPWPGRIRTSREAIIASRLGQARTGQPPARADAVDALTTHPDSRAPTRQAFGDALRIRPVFVECRDCGRPAQLGHGHCAACMNWPLCKGSCGIRGVSERRVDPSRGSDYCPACEGSCGEASEPFRSLSATAFVDEFGQHLVMGRAKAPWR
ncbi:hypothetical protein OHS70_38690 (plasmid) [Streptomyces sp. NBC_00390]|uniref:hypothetical protein n=1 Tax=Streptomyces sp. NBC_00390 TaxID=2975736 RepID=UPI002E24FA40